MKMLSNIKNRFNIIRPALLVFFIVFLGGSCKEPLSEVYVISKEDSLHREKHTRSDGIVLMPPIIPYGEFTFLVDSNYHLYFYGLPKDSISGVVGDDVVPHSYLLDLTPDNVFSIPLGNEKEFFEINVGRKGTSSHKNIVIASSRDTIVSDFIPFLRQIKNDSLSKWNITFRRTLEEEERVLNLKTDLIKGKKIRRN